MMDWILFGPARLVAAWPFAAAAIGLVLILAQCLLDWRSRGQLVVDARFFREAPVFVGLVWLIFGLYERQVEAIFASGPMANNAPFRIDLVVLVPILYVLSAAAIHSLVKQWQRK
jgi:ABC-type amino acid transport system permease subunit